MCTLLATVRPLRLSTSIMRQYTAKCYSRDVWYRFTNPMEPVENVMTSTLHALLFLKSRRMLLRFFGVTSPSTRR